MPINEKFIYYKNKRTNTLQVQYLTKQLQEEQDERKRKLRSAMYIQEKKAKEEAEDVAKRGYCPQCFSLRAKNGTCSCI